MICQTCRGKRSVPDYSTLDAKVWLPAEIPQIPCPDCLGGEQYCCEGDQCQPIDYSGLLPRSSVG